MLFHRDRNGDVGYYLRKGAGWALLPLPEKPAPGVGVHCQKFLKDNVGAFIQGAGAFRFDGQSWRPLPGHLNEQLKKNVEMEKYTPLPDGGFLLLLRDQDIHYLYRLRPDLSLAQAVVFRFREAVLGACPDEAGTYWIASHSGLLRVFPAFTNLFSEDNPVMLPAIHTVVEDKAGNIWFGSYARSVGYYDGESVHPEPEYLSAYTGILPGSYCGKDGNLLFLPSTRPGFMGLIAVNPEEKKVNMALPLTYGYILRENNNGQLIFGTTRKGLFIQRDAGCGYVDSCWIKIGPEKGFGIQNITGVVQDQHGQYWMGHYTYGLAVYLPEQDTVLNWLTKTGQTKYGGWSFEADQRGNLWMGTSDGLFFLEPPRQPKPDFDIDSHLISVVRGVTNERAVHSVKLFRDSLLVLLTHEGMGILNIPSWYRNPSAPILHYFTPKEGYSGGFGEQNAILIDSKKRIWWANDKGVTCFDPNLYVKDKTWPTVRITRLSSYGDELLADSNRAKKLQAKHTNIRIGFSAASSPLLYDNIVYRYQLNDDTLIQTAEKEAAFQNLAPGSYSFKVFALKHGMISEPAVIDFRIPQVWYKDGRAYIGLLLLLAALAYWWYRNRLRQDLYRRRLMSARVQAIVNQLNPHFINNSLNWLQIRADDQHDSEAVSVIGRLAENIRIIFQNSRHKRSFHSLEEELKIVWNYCYIQKIRFEDKLNYYLPEPDQADRLGEAIDVPLMILQIHVENAIEHGVNNKRGGGYVRVSAETEGEHVILKVEDDGVGRKEAMRIGSVGTQQGTRMLAELIRIFNSKNHQKITQRYEDEIYTDATGKGFGTRVIITIPKKYQYAISD